MREIEKALRFAKRTVNDLVVVLARPSLRIAPKINPDEQGARSTRNNLSCFSGHNSPPARKRAHNSHTRCGEDQVLSAFEEGFIDPGNSVAEPPSADRATIGHV